MSTTQSVIEPLTPAEDVTTTVVLAVSDVTGTPVDELPPLYDAVDPDALSTLFQPRCDADDSPGPGTQVTFSMAGCVVSVRGGRVFVTPESDPTDETATARSVQEG